MTNNVNLVRDSLGTLSNGLVAYYPFDGNAYDVSGNGNDGIAYFAALSTDRFGNIDSSYSFNGYSSYILIDGSPFNFFGEFSISLWINPAATQVAYAALVDKTHYCGQGGYIIQQNDYSIDNFYVSYMMNNGQQSNPSYAYDIDTIANSWNNLMITAGGSSVSSYLNGNLVNKQYGISVSMSSNGNLPLLIGAVNSGCTINPSQIIRYFSGKIDEVMFWDRTLSATKVQELYNMQLTMTAVPSLFPTGITKAPSLFPTAISKAPSLFPRTISKAPSLFPSDVPSDAPNYSHEPTISPTFAPTISPTFGPTKQNIINIQTGGTYIGTSACDIFNINSPLPASVTGGGGVDEFYIFPNEDVTYTITDFNPVNERIDLTAFDTINNKNDLNIGEDTESSVLITLPDTNNQMIRLLNMSPSEIKTGNFVFSPCTATTEKTDNHSVPDWVIPVVASVIGTAFLVVLVLYVVRCVFRANRVGGSGNSGGVPVVSATLMNQGTIDINGISVKLTGVSL